MAALLTLRLKRGRGKHFLKGHPWLFAGDIIPTSEHLLAQPGELAQIVDQKGRVMAIGYFNARAQLAFRKLSSAPEPIEQNFFIERLRIALDKRTKAFPEPYYRLVHAEGDNLPGLIIDRFGDTCVLQVATWGIERLLPQVIEALDRLISPKAIVLRNDFAARELEGLPREVKLLRGIVPPWVEVHENGAIYYADLMNGQKTGWFYDQRDNRALVATRAEGRTVLDLYCNAGGFGILAAKNGARRVTLVDSSALALELAHESARKNGVEDLCTFRKSDARAAMEAFAREKTRFGIVVVDPPAFIKRKEDIEPGLKAYTTLAREAAMLVEDGGLLMIASCSHNASRPRFREAVMTGIKQTGRLATVLNYSGHGTDHPVHPHLPQSEYLKALLIRCQDGYPEK